MAGAPARDVWLAHLWVWGDLCGITRWPGADRPGLETSMMVDEASDLEGARDAARGSAPRHSRRLSDKILIAFHHACDQADYEVAEQLLRILEMMLTRRPVSPDTNRRRN